MAQARRCRPHPAPGGRVEDSWSYRPGQFDGITAPTLLVAGSDSGPALAEATQQAAAAIPNAHVRVLDGHGHFAFKTEPAVFAAIMRNYISS